ncbi:uncharacterized protein METZ01_LOCUS269840, partial [marine metagenome]
MKIFQKRVGFLLVFSASLILLLLSCSKKDESNSTADLSVPCYINSPSSKGTCESGGTLTAS